MNVLRVEFIREIGKLREYKVTYEENDVFITKVVGRTFNYDEEEIENIPEKVLDFVEVWILGDL